MSIKTEIVLEVQFIQDGDYVVAYNPDLKLSSFGKTVDEAFNAFDEMLQLWVQETQELGTFEELMANAGFTLSYIPSHQSYDFKISEPDSTFFYNEIYAPIIETRQKRLQLA